MFKRVKVKVKIGDLVELIATSDKGRRSKIKKIIIRPYGRVLVLVEGCNIVKKHVKANPEKNKLGGIVSKESLMDISNIKIVREAAQA